MNEPGSGGPAGTTPLMWGDGLTEDEVARFALQLREAERIRAMMAEEREDASANRGSTAGQA